MTAKRRSDEHKHGALKQVVVVVVVVIPGDRRCSGNMAVEEVGIAVDVGRLCADGPCVYAVAPVLPWVLVALVLIVRCSAVTSCRVFAGALLPRLGARGRDIECLLLAPPPIPSAA